MKVLVRILLVIAIIATSAFVFYNSTLPPDASAEQSGAFGDIIAEIIPPDTTVGSFIQEYLRKIAHFTEFGLLGIEVTLLILIADKKRFIHFVRSFYFAVTVALTDESIQIFSARGPMLEDVLIDIGGYVFFGALTLVFVAVFSLIRYLIGHRRYKY